jgi:outer membrane lipoprotein SlyB
MNDKPKRDWQKTRIHFFCGAILGGLLAFASGGGWLTSLITAISVGAFAAIFLDRFWEDFLRWWN